MKRLFQLGVVTSVMLLVPAGPAYVQDLISVQDLQTATIVLYLMVATALVSIMHAGFSMLEAGLIGFGSVASGYVATPPVGLAPGVARMTEVVTD